MYRPSFLTSGKGCCEVLLGNFQLNGALCMRPYKTLPYAELFLTGRCKEGQRTGSLFVTWHTDKSSSRLAFCHANQQRLCTVGSCNLGHHQLRLELYVSPVPFSRMFDNKRFICLFAMTTVFKFLSPWCKRLLL